MARGEVTASTVRVGVSFGVGAEGRGGLVGVQGVADAPFTHEEGITQSKNERDF